MVGLVKKTIVNKKTIANTSTTVVSTASSDKASTVTSEYEETIVVVDSATAIVGAGTDILHITYTEQKIGECLIVLASSNLTDRKQPLTIKDAGGKTKDYHIVITTEGSETIDGNELIAMWTNYSSVELYTDGSNWFIK